jgi:hypothetical protein
MGLFLGFVRSARGRPAWVVFRILCGPLAAGLHPDCMGSFLGFLRSTAMRAARGVVFRISPTAVRAIRGVVFRFLRDPLAPGPPWIAAGAPVQGLHRVLRNASAGQAWPYGCASHSFSTAWRDPGSRPRRRVSGAAAADARENGAPSTHPAVMCRPCFGRRSRIQVPGRLSPEPQGDRLLHRRPAALARHADRGYLQRPRSLRLAAQDVALSRRKQGFESPRERHSKLYFSDT